MKTVDLDTLESNLEQSLDAIYSMLERIKIKNQVFLVNLGIEKKLNEVAQYLQKIETKYPKSSAKELFVQQCLHHLLNWFSITSELTFDRDVDSLLQNSLTKLESICQEYLKLDASYLLDQINQLDSVTHELNQIKTNNSFFQLYFSKLSDFSTITTPIPDELLWTHTVHTAPNFITIPNLVITPTTTNVIPLVNELNVEIYVKDADISKEFLTVSLLIKVLSLGSKNIVTIESIRTGSLWINLKVKFLNFWNKEQTQQIINDSVDEIKAYGKRQQTENKKNLSETEKNTLEAKQLARELNSQSEEDVKLQKTLELRKANADLIGQELDNELKKLEIIQKYSELMTSGVLQIDQVEFKIGDQLIIKKNGGQISGNRLE